MEARRADGRRSTLAVLVAGLCAACSATLPNPATPGSRSSTQPHAALDEPDPMAPSPVASDGATPSPSSEDQVDASRAEPACPPPDLIETLPSHDPPQRFSVGGYQMRHLPLRRSIGSEEQLHCLQVAWPPGEKSSAGKTCRVASTIDEAWMRAIANTLERVPWSHVRLLDRIVIDNRPVEHGIAPFSRDRTDDARDGHTMWLHEHVFLDPNHYARGNYGRYWSYHVNVDDTTIDGSPAEHDLFSPVLLHELGHLVMYHLVNVGRTGSETASVPECATTCRDDGSCADLRSGERERGCISPYCGPIRLPGSSENWAEQYRFYYQSSVTREIVRQRFGCAERLAELGEEDGSARAPWELGLPDVIPFHPSRWSSCSERACKTY